MLDFGKLLPQIQVLAAEHQQQATRRCGALAAARKATATQGGAWERAARRADAAKTSWLLALPCERFDRPIRVPDAARADAYIAVAADGSQIEPDRHEAMLCAVLNVGTALLRYGRDARAELLSEPRILVGQDDLPEEVRGERGPAGGKRLAARRFDAECQALARLVAQAGQEGLPAIALGDGSLILWSLQNEPPACRDEVLGRFQTMLEAARCAGVPVLGYISRPGSRDVVNTLRVCLCPDEAVDCDRRCPSSRYPGRSGTPCAEVADTTDAELFSALLGPGERSAVFASDSRILEAYRPEHRVRWFYLNTGWEIARVELPAWAADDQALLGRSHALALDQARKGMGYPPSLAEAHERAVVGGADREAFLRLVEGHLARTGAVVARTRKAVSKRVRYI